MATTTVMTGVHVIYKDRTQVNAEIDWADQTAWGDYAAAHDYELGEMHRMLGFLAWRDARKTGRCPQDVGLDEFNRTVLAVNPQIIELDPTQPEPGTG